MDGWQIYTRPFAWCISQRSEVLISELLSEMPFFGATGKFRRLQ